MGCNGFSGDYELDEGHLEVPELLSTAMTCIGDVATAEGLYLRVLRASDARVTLRDAEPVLTGTASSWLRPPTAGVGRRPRRHLMAPPGGRSRRPRHDRAGSPALLGFGPDGTFEAGTGCGAVSGTWDARRDGVTTAVDAHEADCGSGLREQDGHVAAVFAHGFEGPISRGRLLLTGAEGRSIEYVDSVHHDAD